MMVHHVRQFAQNPKPRHVFLRLGAGTDELVRVILVTGTVLDRSFSQ